MAVSRQGFNRTGEKVVIIFLLNRTADGYYGCQELLELDQSPSNINLYFAHVF
jgi:hypothetical protein